MPPFSPRPLSPAGQVLAATLLFCLIFAALFLGLYKSGLAYLFKERSHRATDLTALSAGAVYANGLQLVRESNILLMAAATFDAWTIGTAVSAALLAPPPLDIAAVTAAAKAADPHTRDRVQELQALFFGIGVPTGPYPALIFGEAASVAESNLLRSPPLSAFNAGTAGWKDLAVPNMALRFRKASELLEERAAASYSLRHDGIRHYFAEGEVEPALNPQFPGQRRVRKDLPSPYSGWWVRREEGAQGSGPSLLGGMSLASWGPLKKFLQDFKLDITDRDDPPCHTYTLLGAYPGGPAFPERDFHALSEARVNADGLAAWDLSKPISIQLERPDLGAFPLLRKLFPASLPGLPGPPGTAGTGR